MSANPNKWVRKAFYDACNGMTVDALTIPVYDVRATNYSGDNYILLSTQLNSPDRTKCGFSWEHTVELQIVTRKKKNAGSRLLGDNIVDAVLINCANLTLDAGSGMEILDQEVEVGPELLNETESEIVIQHIIRYIMRIN